ncbi:MAG: helix-turn-helix domain-containing protein [Myxococcota bacterium]
MGRRKTYDREAVAQRAMLVFWQQGYDGTTIGELEDALQINRYSLFAEFGSKQGLFEAALAVYEASIIEANLGGMEAPGASVDEIVAFLGRFRGGTEAQALAGCMLCNAAVEQAPDSPKVRARALAYFDRLRKALHHALGGGDAAALHAAALSSAVLGGFVQARGGMSAKDREQALDGLEAWVRALA